MAREAAVCLAKPVEAVSLGSLEELSSYVKVLWGHQVAVTAHKGAFGVVMFQCALRWGSSALCQTLHDKAGCAKAEAILSLLAHRWLSRASARAAVASGWGPRCDLCPRGCDQIEASSVCE